MAAFSGLLSYGLISLAGNVPVWLPVPADVFRYAPGLLFGALVLQMGTQGSGRRIALVLASGLIWYLTFKAAGHLVMEYQASTLLACGVAGGLGAWLVSLVVRLLKPRRLSLLAMLMAFVTGTLGGCMIGQALLQPELFVLDQLLLVAGFVVWQLGVGGAMLLVDELGENEYHA
ncbi:MAG: hypothetical protein ACRES4_10480 [Nevskiales bacterium]